MELREDAVTFTINGRAYTVGGKTVTPQTSLNTFIRDHAMLKGTKYMCREGGCGVCIVAVQSTHPVTQKDRYYAVNSCLVSVLSCHGAAIVTVEGIGTKQKGYHEIQQKLATYNGSQCGYCSPGMVMNMYSLVKAKPSLTMEEIENSFGGNICRCTGYRPILDAFKSFANDAPKPPKVEDLDIEDAFKKCNVGGCKTNCDKCPNLSRNSDDEDWEEIDYTELALAHRSLKISLEDSVNWYRVNSVKEIMEILDMIGDNSYCFVAGNTAQGVYRNPPPKKYYIDIKGVPELRSYQIKTSGLELGANMTLTEVMELFNKVANDKPLLFGHTKVMAKHIDLVANVPVRNVGTIAGNLSIKHEHREFSSDIFLLLETAGAVLTICDVSGVVQQVGMLEYLNINMNRKLIVKINLPPISSLHYIMKTYKILPRKQNVHALVNAGFLFRVMNPRVLVEEKPKIVFGGINKNMVHASLAEDFLTGKELLSKEVVKGVMLVLSKELQPDEDPHKNEPSPEYRKNLASSLLYKFILNVCSAKVDKRFLSGGSSLERPLSSSSQDFKYDGKYKPAGIPVQKLEAQIQTSGEAEYVNDIPESFGQLYGALIITDRATADLKHVDATKALALPGVVRFFSAQDIPGTNSFITLSPPLMVEPEEIFCSGKVLYAGQPVGMIVATTQEIADKAADKVEIKYANQKPPLLTIKEVLKTADKGRIIPQSNMERTKPPGAVDYKLNGEFELGGQYHFTMELQSCVVIPMDYGLKVYPTTQWIPFTQSAIARMLKVPDNYIQMEVKRLGGAFGCKISRTSLVACACSLAAYLLNKPVKMVVNMEATMKAIGKRCPIYVSYESQSTPGTALHDQRISTNYMVVLHVNSMNFTWNHGLHGSTINFNFRRAGVSSKGVIQSLDINMYGDMGISLNDATWIFVNDGISNAYDTRSFKFNFFGVKTDNPASVWTRAPAVHLGGSEFVVTPIASHCLTAALGCDGIGFTLSEMRGTLESMTTIEHIMEHIAQVTGLAPIDVRLANVSSEFKDTMNEMVSTLKKSSDFDKRVQSAHNFNEENRWKKRGLSMVIMKYGIIFVVPYYATVSIYPGDGSVVITSGGIEMGQGLNTKAAQVCAYAFGIELEMVKVISSLSFTSPGNAPTGGSITSDAVCAAVLNCCEELNSRLGPIKEKMKNPAWPAVVQAANMAGLKLIASHATNNSDPIPQPYPVFGATVTEVEVDILTGQYQILRADILEDAGESMNPSVDIGQIEGAFTMGLGYFGSEELKYEPKTGYNLTHRTWDYYPPGFKDIPIDFRITLRKNAPNPVGVLRSKSAGEPPICMSYSLPLAIRQAVASARKDTGLKDEWFTFNPPCTFEKTYLAAGTVPKDFTL